MVGLLRPDEGEGDHLRLLLLEATLRCLCTHILGAFYFTALLVGAGSAREREWSRARVGVFGVWLFVVLTLVATLLHLDKFHFDDPDLIPRVAAWVWTVVYVAEPPFLLAAIVLQLRAPGRDRSRERTLPAWYRAFVAAQVLVLLVVGLVLFLAPSSVGWWPWTLTPFVARAMASWLLGIAVVLATAVWENDWNRIRIASWGYGALGALQLVAVARYTDDLRGGAATVQYLAFLVLALATGGAGALMARTPSSPQRVPAP